MTGGGGDYGQIKKLRVFSSIQSIIRISHNHTNTCIFLLLNFSFLFTDIMPELQKHTRSFLEVLAVTSPYSREVIVASKCPSSHVVSHCNE